MFVTYKRKMKKNGFTLTELLVVMAIIAILAGLTLTGYQVARKAARDGRRKSDLEQVRSALEMCRTDTGSYPAGPLYSGNNITCGVNTYLQIPNDPSQYRYYYTTTAAGYVLCAYLETGGGSTSCGTNCTVTGGPAVACNYQVIQP